MLDVLVVASAPEAVARTTTSPNATLANMVFLLLIGVGQLTERFSQYDFAQEKINDRTVRSQRCDHAQAGIGTVIRRPRINPMVS
jgi:hypothetical protein